MKLYVADNIIIQQYIF